MSTKIENFKKTQDYIDITYMIKHVLDENARINVLETLGYKIGVDIIKNDDKIGKIIIGKRKELRMQVTQKQKGLNFAKCVIIEKL